MKYILSSSLYFAGLVLLCGMSFIVFEGQVLKLSLILSFVVWTVLYTYTDKLVLIYLNAREVIDTDEQELFQRIKNEVYKTDLPSPRIYLYGGNSKNCFVTESRGSWSVVIDKKLLKSLSEEELEAFVKFLFQYKLKAAALLQTKVMGLSSLLFLAVTALIRNLLWFVGIIYLLMIFQFLPVVKSNPSLYFSSIILVGIFLGLVIKRNSGIKLKSGGVLFRVISLFLMGLARPVFFLFDLIAKREYQVPGELALLPIVNRLERERYNYDQLMVDHLKENFSVKLMIVEHLESFPVLENCSFE